MSIFHCSIKIISRSAGRSVVASAAYRSGERLYDETGLLHDFTKKSGIIMSEIMLPENAPKKYLDRSTLWNEVQQIEKRADAQLAREIEVALPVEILRLEQLACIRAYIQDNFTSQGMIADFAIHDKGDGNPHAHILLTVRGLDAAKGWKQKQKTVFANARDENGKAIFEPTLPSYDPKDKERTLTYRIPALDENGNQKTRVRKGKGIEYLWEKVSIPENDWNSHARAEEWRASWAEHCNYYLEKENQIDHRSYKRQGLEMEPTIHEGFYARQLEVEGKTAERCEINREIRERNSIRIKLLELERELAIFRTQNEEDRNERIRKLMERRRAVDADGGNAESDREIEGRKYGTDKAEERTSGTESVSETEALIRSLRASISSAGSREEDSRTEREDREAKQRRFNLEREREAEKRNVQSWFTEPGFGR